MAIRLILMKIQLKNPKRSLASTQAARMKIAMIQLTQKRRKSNGWTMKSKNNLRRSANMV